MQTIFPAMKSRIVGMLALVATTTCLPATAHEFWLWPDVFTASPPGSVRLAQRVGENFVGDVVPFSTTHVFSMWHYSNTGTKNLMTRIPGATLLPAMTVELTAGGTHLVAVDTRPSVVTLPAEKFSAYLRDEGLDAILAMREASGVASTPGRERFRRNVKTLLRAGGKSDAIFSTRTHQQLEITPSSNPFTLRPGGRFAATVRFGGKPLGNALVKAWHRMPDGRLTVIRNRSTATGAVRFTLPYAGPWMISTVHMIPTVADQDIDWDSFWGNMTFSLPEQ